jgi:hypothetical protein
MTTKEIKLWKSSFGDNYVARNQLSDQDIANRMQLWQSSLSMLCIFISIPNSFLELGAGIGGNLTAIGNIYKSYGKTPELYAIEPNFQARKYLQDIEFVSITENINKIDTASIDLTFTSGVLIHIHPNDVLNTMKELYRVSKKWIVCIEYFSPELRELNYHNKQALWTQDFGGLWLNNFKLRCISYSFHWKRMTGLDNVTCWVFEKVN